MQVARKERMSNIELLRILAMFMVVSLHYLDKGGFLQKLPGVFEKESFLPWILEAFCIGAVNIYVLIAGYFMVDSTFKISRAVKLWLQILFYALLIPMVLIAFSVISVKDLTIYELLQYLFPIYMEHYWFGTEYLFLLLLSPVLNAGVKVMSQKQLKQVLAVLLVTVSVVPSILPVSLSYDKSGYNLLWFLVLYMTAAYIRLYGFSVLNTLGKALGGFLAATAGIFVWMYALNLFAVKSGRLSEKVTMSFHYNHILVWFAAVCIFMLFLQIKAPGGIFGRVINWAALGTFGIYLFHEHLTLRYEWMKWFPGTEGKFHFGWYLVAVLCIMAAGIGIDFLRRMLFEWGEKLILCCKRKGFDKK